MATKIRITSQIKVMKKRSTYPLPVREETLCCPLSTVLEGFKERNAEGSFGTGGPNRSRPSRLIPVSG